MILFPGTRREMQVGTYRAQVEAGDRALNLTAGGGGYGDPAQRDPQRVLEDVLDDYVSEEAARKIYRVVIEGGRVDQEATGRLRARERTPDQHPAEPAEPESGSVDG